MVFKRVDLSYVDLPCVEEVTVRNSREDFALLWLDERRGDIRGLGSDILLRTILNGGPAGPETAPE